MTILYTDTNHTHRVHCDEKGELVRAIAHRYMMFPAYFDILHIDMQGDIEVCEFYHVATQSRVGSMGGASAMAVYRDLAAEFPEINHHFRTPASSQPPRA